MKNIAPIVSIAFLSFTSACASNSGASYDPIVDGPKSSEYQTDLAACQEIAEERAYMNDDNKQNMMIGAAIGAVAGIADDEVNDTEGAVGGAVAGAIAGGIQGSVEARGERQDIVIKCMAGRGHKVVG